MSRLLLGVSLLAVSWATALASESAVSPVRCGTRWLQEEHAAGRMLLPQGPTMGVAKPAQTTPIEVGTQLLFPVSGSITLIPATCQRVGEHAYVFVENRQWDTNGGSVLQSHVDALGTLFDASSPADSTRGVFEIEAETFGEPADVDGDPRIYLLVLDISGGNIVGYFDRSVAEHATPEYRRDVLFLDETFLRRKSHLALGTLAHEFQHLIHWRWDDDEDPWVDEGLSGYAEELLGFPEADANAVPAFLSEPYTSLSDFDNSAGAYGATYLFTSFLAERYGAGLIREFVAQPRNGTEGLDAALEARQVADRFIDVWQDWAVGNYASEDEHFAYGALGHRRVMTIDVGVEALPMQSAPAFVAGRWGTVSILFRTPGDLLVDFDGEDPGLYSVSTYAMDVSGGTRRHVTLDGDNRGVAQLTGIDSAVVIVGRRSRQGGGFHLSARALTPTAVTAGETVLPLAVSLEPAYPNPFNSTVHIPYTIAAGSEAELVVFDLMGQLVRRLARGWHVPGHYDVTWDGLDTNGQPTASGTYLARLRTDGSVHVTTLALIR